AAARYGYGAPEYSEHIENGLTRVDAVIHAKVGPNAQDAEVHWWIDPARDWNIVRTSITVSGEPLIEHRVELQRIDGMWIPSQIDSYDKDEQAGPRCSWQIIHAELNRPNLPASFTANDIGFESGMQVRVRELGGETSLRYWTGADLVEQDEFQNG